MYLSICFLYCLNFVRAAPLEKVMVDMSYTYDEKVKNYLTWESFNMTVTMNGTTHFGSWIWLEEFRMSTHMGTHMDSPSHFFPGGLDIDQIPLSSLIAPVAVISIAERAAEDPDTLVSVEDLQAWESTTGQSFDGMMVLLNTCWSAKWHNLSEFLGTTERDVFQFRCPGFGEEATQWLVDNRSIKGIGSDALSFDKCSSRDYPSHRIILSKGLIGLESVANVDKIPIYGATLHMMPMKIGRGSGAPTRIIATYPKVIF